MSASAFRFRNVVSVCFKTKGNTLNIDIVSDKKNLRKKITTFSFEYNAAAADFLLLFPLHHLLSASKTPALLLHLLYYHITPSTVTLKDLFTMDAFGFSDSYIPGPGDTDTLDSNLAEPL